MKFDLSNNIDVIKFNQKVKLFIGLKKKVELKSKVNSRTTLQNSSLHLYFTFISDALNEIGSEFTYTGVKGINLSTRYTPLIVKEFFWKPIQKTLFNIESTTQLTSKQINEIIDIVTKFFGDKGIDIDFPSIETLERHYLE